MEKKNFLIDDSEILKKCNDINQKSGDKYDRIDKFINQFDKFLKEKNEQKDDNRLENLCIESYPQY